MEDIKEPTEVEKAQAVLEADEKIKQETFVKELDDLCKKHRYALQAQSQIVLNKIK